MAKKMENNNYGVYKVDGKSFILKKDGFANTYECQKWIRGKVSKSEDEAVDMGGEYAIMSLRKKFKLQTKTTVSVKLIESGSEQPASKTVK